MATVFLTVGPPGAGKTTFVSWKLVAAGEMSANYVLNPDGLLFDRTGYRWSQERVTRAWQATRADYELLLVSGQSRVGRHELGGGASAAAWRPARAAGHRVVAVWFESAVGVADRARQAARDDPTKRVGQEVFAASWKPSSHRPSPKDSTRCGRLASKATSWTGSAFRDERDGKEVSPHDGHA